MKNSQQAKDETLPPGTVVLTDEEQEECQQMLRSLTQEEDGEWVVREDTADGFTRSIIAHCLMGRAERFLQSAGGNISYSTLHVPDLGETVLEPELAEKACTSASKACAIFRLSIHFYDFGCILMQVGKSDEAKVMFSEFLRQVEADETDPMKQIWLKQRDVEAAKEFAGQMGTRGSTLSVYKNSFDNAAMSDVADGLSIVLLVQLAVAGIGSVEATKIEIKTGCINRKAIGYIYGFIDCALQCRGEDITNLDVGLPIVFHVMRKLFPGHEQTYIDFLMFHMEDEVVVLGMMSGGQEYNEFLHHSRPPFGLAKFIRETASESAV